MLYSLWKIDHTHVFLWTLFTVGIHARFRHESATNRSPVALICAILQLQLLGAAPHVPLPSLAVIQCPSAFRSGNVSTARPVT